MVLSALNFVAVVLVVGEEGCLGLVDMMIVVRFFQIQLNSIADQRDRQDKTEQSSR